MVSSMSHHVSVHPFHIPPSAFSKNTHRIAETPAFYRHVPKRLFDVTVVLLTAPLTLLIVATTALLMVLKGLKPFYFQERIGRHGKVFVLWKLQTMVPDADRRLQEHLERNPEAKREWDVHQKLQNDPRVTAFGAFLHKTSPLTKGFAHTPL